MKRWWLLLGRRAVRARHCDEIVAIHDRFQDATGHPGQIILIPVAIVGVVAWWKVLDEISGNRMARTLFIAGAAFWFVSQVSRRALSDADIRWTITPEEIGETLGSTLLALRARLLAVRRAAGRPVPAQAGRRAC